MEEGSILDKPARILIVDDDPSVIQALSGQFLADGHQVWSASGPAEAARLASERVFDLILLDILLSGRKGLDLIHELKGASGARVVIMTGHAGDAIREDAMLLGAAELIGKPFDYPQLARLLRATPSR